MPHGGGICFYLPETFGTVYLLRLRSVQARHQKSEQQRDEYLKTCLTCVGCEDQAQPDIEEITCVQKCQNSGCPTWYLRNTNTKTLHQLQQATAALQNA